MRDCVSIFQRLKLTPEERLEKYVKDHYIVDIDDVDGRGRNLQIFEEDSDDVDDADESEGDDINDDTFPDCEKDDVPRNHSHRDQHWQSHHGVHL